MKPEKVYASNILVFNGAVGFLCRAVRLAACRGGCSVCGGNNRCQQTSGVLLSGWSNKGTVLLFDDANREPSPCLLDGDGEQVFVFLVLVTTQQSGLIVSLEGNLPGSVS